MKLAWPAMLFSIFLNACDLGGQDRLADDCLEYHLSKFRYPDTARVMASTISEENGRIIINVQAQNAFGVPSRHTLSCPIRPFYFRPVKNWEIDNSILLAEERERFVSDCKLEQWSHSQVDSQTIEVQGTTTCRTGWITIRLFDGESQIGRSAGRIDLNAFTVYIQGGTSGDVTIEYSVIEN